MNKIFKRRIGVIIIFFAAFTAMLVSFPAGAQKSVSPGDIVAVVNGSTISRAEFDGELEMVKQRFSEQGRVVTEDQLKQIEKSILETLINRELLYQQSKKNEIRITEQEILDQLQKIKRGFPSESEFQEALKRINISETDIKNQIKRALAIRELIDMQVAQKIEVSDKESKAYYDTHLDSFKQPEQVKASHILIKVDSGADALKKAKARDEIKAIQKKLADGEDFAEVARKFSQGPSSARGGDLGYFKRGDMVKPFEEAAFTLKINEISDIVETRFGYHLIKVFDKKPERTIEYEEVKPRLTEYLKQQKTQQEIDRYIEKLRSEAVIERML
ncbi:MAG: peptidylprolyl isomerase [Deltaproteobacteria bacterium]|nr:peptidylprolyl isomerase [Deltaproteobacteria bacterium]MBW1960880.1 peptidylprolyl isomerase [Deltaproteobacteria bacterium]MBW1995797.1 peptidylprolyl isomerase [Deltaproteobacteria bacterium]MBW2152555.1 peptidylprolyl isomerase [Deltaproteobacteria bacterium]